MFLSLLLRDKVRTEALADLAAHVFDFFLWQSFLCTYTYALMFAAREHQSRITLHTQWRQTLPFRSGPIIETKLQHHIHNRAIPFHIPETTSGTQPNPYPIRLPHIHPSTAVPPHRPPAPRTPSVHLRRRPPGIQPAPPIPIRSAPAQSHEDVAPAVRPGDREPEAVVGAAAVERADGVVDGEAEDGAGAGVEGDAPGQGGAVYRFGIADGDEAGRWVVAVAGLAGAGGVSGDGGED